MGQYQSMVRLVAVLDDELSDGVDYGASGFVGQVVGNGEAQTRLGCFVARIMCHQ